MAPRSSTLGLIQCTIMVVLLVSSLPSYVSGLVDSFGENDLALYNSHFVSLTQNHFTEILPDLVKLVHTEFADSLYSTVVNYEHVEENALGVRNIMEASTEDSAYLQLTKLRMFLVSHKALANMTHLSTLETWSDNVVLNPFLTRVTLTDVFPGDSDISSSQRALRALLLGLNVLTVYGHNLRSNTSTLKLNHLSILHPSELVHFKGYIPDPNRSNKTVNGSEMLLQTSIKLSILAQDLPESVDWIEQGVVGPIVNQGSCGSCWAFAAIAVMESRLAISTGKLTSLSEQQFTSCIESNGCAGGAYESAWEYAQTANVVSSAAYPYKSWGTHTSPSCKTKTLNEGIATIPAGSNIVSLFTESQMMQAVATSGPIAIAISTPDCFSQYSSGVLTQADCSCYTGTVDHAVTIVGYGTTANGIPYWKVRNSWGTAWGIAGYILLERGVGFMGMCGLLTDPSYPTSVSLSPECQAPNPPSYCNQAMQKQMYTNINVTTGETMSQCVPSYAGEYSNDSCKSSAPLPAWAWVLIGIAIALVCIMLICLVKVCCERYAPSDAPYNVFSKPNKDGNQLLSKQDIEAGKGPVPNSDPRAFSKESTLAQT